MQKITLEAYAEATKNTRNRISVASKLDEFLTKVLSSAKSKEAYEISVSDFADVKEAHYYTALKMLNEKYSKIIAWRFILKTHARFEKLFITVK